jgi:hypothetical protein
MVKNILLQNMDIVLLKSKCDVYIIFVFKCLIFKK